MPMSWRTVGDKLAATERARLILGDRTRRWDDDKL